jgi:hypothetical protein
MAFPQQATCSEIQLDLILDYRTNPELHPSSFWQEPRPTSAIYQRASVSP